MQKMKSVLSLLATLLLVGLANVSEARVGTDNRKLFPTPTNPIEGQFLVLFKSGIEDVDATVLSLLAALPGVSILFTYHYAIKGVALAGVTAQVVDVLEDIDLVDIIIAVRYVSIPFMSRTKNSEPFFLE